MIEVTQTLFGTHTQEIIEGDCLSVMKTYPENHFNMIICDPPYMLNFMNKKFDKFENNPAANPEYWKEALRISKPGTMLAAFGGDRTHHHLMNALEQAGWEIRTCLYWIFSNGFPKSCNFGRKLTPEWNGYGTALKPSVEIIVLAMKPVEKTFAFNAEKWGVSGINIDISRIEGKKPDTIRGSREQHDRYLNLGAQGFIIDDGKGRWPASCIFSESMAKILDDQSGITKSQAGWFNNKLQGRIGPVGLKGGNRTRRSPEDSGGASRFFKTIEDEPPFFYCPKASPSERNGSTHPTVKPLKLMKYLIQLLAPPKDALCLDPFMGSGTTLLAAKQLEINAIGIEKEPEYCRIAERRIKDES